MITESTSRISPVVLTSNGLAHGLAWRRWATQHRVAAALLAGVVATHISTVLAFWFGDFGLFRLDWPTDNGRVYLPHMDPVIQFFVGGAMHYLDGIAFAVLFAINLHPRLPWANSQIGNIFKGMVFGTVLGMISLTVLCPLVYGPALGAQAGILSSHFGWKFQVSVLLFHWIYGAHLGLVYSPLDNLKASK